MSEKIIVTEWDLKQGAIYSGVIAVIGISVTVHTGLIHFLLMIMVGLFWQFFFIDLYIKEFRDKNVSLESNRFGCLH